MIFQEPATSLNPVIKTGRQVSEPLWLNRLVTKTNANTQSASLLAKVDIPDPKKRAEQYPHEFSGGMRQRAMSL